MKRMVLSMLSVMMMFLAFASGPEKEGHAIERTNTYVLVHGAWQAPYVWNAVKAQLESKGNKVVVVELPGHGADFSPEYQLTLEVYRDKVAEAIARTEGKVILVGHSMGGMVISAVAEQMPERIGKLVYIGAFVPADGQALVDLAFSDRDSKLGPLLTESADKLTLGLQADGLTYLFIDDGDAAAKEEVVSHYRAEPAIPFTNKVRLTKERFGSVGKVYIKTLQDRVISMGLQDRMIAAAGIKRVYTINTSHSPFLAQPEALWKLLATVVP